MTICIATICDYEAQDLPPAIIMCADRLVSAGIQFEGASPKIRGLTPYCLAMQSSNDSLTSDLILEQVKERANALDKPPRIIEIVEMIKAQCIELKKKWIEETILAKYNLTFEHLATRPESIVKEAINEVRYCNYPYDFSYIVLGIEEQKDAHMYVIDQDGQYRLQDSLGFAVIGSGSQLAFLEMTKHGYDRRFPAIVAITRVYMAKKVSERAEGVGRNTDMMILHFADKKDGKFHPSLAILPMDILAEKMNEVYEALIKNEKAELEKLNDTIWKALKPRMSPNPDAPQV